MSLYGEIPFSVKMKVLLFLGLSAALLFGDGKGAHHRDRTNKTMAFFKIARPNAYFAFKLFKQLAAAHPTENIFFSPLSVSTAFAMLSEGAKGQTHDQILEGLGFNVSKTPEDEIHAGFQDLQNILNDPASELELSSGNALFIAKDLKLLPSFLDDVSKNYKAEAFSTDFENSDEAKQQINSYVERKTNGKIAELLKSVAKESMLVLANYIYFKGKWKKPFDETYTKEKDFHVDKDTVVKVPFMFRSGKYNSLLSKDVTVVEVPYNGNASAIFILPRNGNLKELEENLHESFREWRSKFATRTLDLHIPKFSIKANLDLKEELSKLGVTRVFSNEADLLGLQAIEKPFRLLHCTAVHKATLSIDEKGTEAAGATGIEITPTSLPPSVIIDVPFLFAVYKSDTHSLLFFGRIVNPLAT
uniref:Serpin domain-containing protein n=1 Tax=Leptobrachium leishanense TaxID=445787 RepID=A0A8C5QWG7_9ANUR